MILYIAENINYLRKKGGLTRPELAGALNVKQSRLNAWLEGRSTPGIFWLVDISNLFNVTLHDLVVEDLKLKADEKGKYSPGTTEGKQGSGD